VSGYDAHIQLFIGANVPSKVEVKVKASAGFHSRPFYSAATAVTAFRTLGVYPGKIATPRIRTRVGGFVASVLVTLTS